MMSHGLCHDCAIKSSFFTTQSLLLTTLYKRRFEKSVGEGENAGNQHSLLFPHQGLKLTFFATGNYFASRLSFD